MKGKYTKIFSIIIGIVLIVLSITTAYTLLIAVLNPDASIIILNIESFAPIALAATGVYLIIRTAFNSKDEMQGEKQ